jgi:cytochrome c oxidase subunit II
MATRSSSSRRLLGLGLISAVATIATGCNALADPRLPQTTVFPLSDWGNDIQGLYNIIFILAAIVFVLVEGAFLYAIIRYRRRPDNRLPTQNHGNTTLEIMWTIFPAVILLFIAVPTIGTIFKSDAPPVRAESPNLRVTVIGHQWWWEFQYPDLGITTANELHLPAGQTAVFDLESIDVIHSFWFPRMGGKVDAIPTRTNHMWFTPDAQSVGEYYGQCVEFCGLQHANMRMRLFVDTPQDFQRWVEQNRANAVPVQSQVSRGGAIFLGGNCVTCHTVRGTLAQGKIGPDLTHVGSRTTIAAGMLENTPENLQRWIQHPSQIKVGTKMPDLGLSDQDVRDIAAYLLTLK